MNRCVIVGGAGINNYPRIKNKLQSDDFYVVCDCGLKHIESLDIVPNLIVGDFDSHEKPDTGVETIVLPREKDDTDTFYAVKEAIKRGYADFLLIGAIGDRLDHSLGNVSILMYLDSLGFKGEISDDYSDMEIVSDGASVSDEYEYFSLIAVGGEANGVVIKNAKFPLNGESIAPIYQYGVSNETLPGKTAKISLESGKLLLIRVDAG